MNSAALRMEVLDFSAGLKRAGVALPAAILLCLVAVAFAPEDRVLASPLELLSMKIGDLTLWEFSGPMLVGTIVLLGTSCAITVFLAWLFAIIDRRLGTAASIAFDTLLTIVAATPVLATAMGLSLALPELTVLVVFVLPFVGVSVPLAVAFHFVRRHLQPAAGASVSAVMQAWTACLPLLFLLVLVVEHAFQRPGIGFLLVVVAGGEDLALAIVLALLFVVIALVLDVLSTAVMQRIGGTSDGSERQPAIEAQRQDRFSTRSGRWRMGLGMVMIGLIGALLVAGLASGRSADESDFDAVTEPAGVSRDHLLGVDRIGRDNLAKVVAATETSLGNALLIGLVVAALGRGLAALIRASHGIGRRMVKLLADGLAVIPWPCLALVFAAAGIPHLIVLAVAANTIPVIARAIADDGADPRRYPAAIVGLLSVAYTLFVGTGLELSQLGPEIPAHTLGSLFFLNLAGAGLLALIVTVAVPVIAIVGLVHLSFAALRRAASAEDVYARVF